MDKFIFLSEEGQVGKEIFFTAGFEFLPKLLSLSHGYLLLFNFYYRTS